MRPLGLPPLAKGLLIAALHVGIVASIGAKLLYDRHTRPRVWALTRPYDPNLPIRGRYLSLQLVVEPEGFPPPRTGNDLWRWAGDLQQRRARLEVRNGKLVAVHDDNGEFYVWFAPAPGAPQLGSPELDQDKPVIYPTVAVLESNVLYFIPEHAHDPTPRWDDRANELWAEVTVPRKGPPRPIQLALKKNGVWTPLDLR